MSTTVTVDELWDALRDQCCVLKRTATTITQMRKQDVKLALDAIRKAHNEGRHWSEDLPPEDR